MVVEGGRERGAVTGGGKLKVEMCVYACTHMLTCVWFQMEDT